MGIHEGFQFVALFEFLGSGKPFLLLLLVEHHLFDDATSLAVQVRQLGVLGLDLLRVNFLVANEDAVPPVLTLHLG